MPLLTAKGARGNETRAPQRQSKKRKRDTDDRSSANAKKQISTGAVGLDADALHWKEVALPNHFDDAEGFFGLEEIEGVEVLRLEGLGKAPRFKVRIPYPLSLKCNLSLGKVSHQLDTGRC